MATILVTHVTQYAGPGIVAALHAEGQRVLCHDASFATADRRRDFERDHPGTTALAAQTADAIAAEAQLGLGAVDGLVVNAVHPITNRPIEDIPLDDFRDTFEAVLVFPVRLAQLALPAMKARRAGAIVFITSARQLRPEPGFAVPTSIRAGATAFAAACAREAAPFGVQVNTVAPNYLESELYYPKARFVDDPAGRAQIAATVPMGRLGRPDEIGALVAFLVSGRSAFTTGQTIAFAGGWP